MRDILRQGTLVEYHLNGDESQVGYGRIVGRADNGNCLLGRSYIIEPDILLDQEIYPYSHFVLPEVWFTVQEELSIKK